MAAVGRTRGHFPEKWWFLIPEISGVKVRNFHFKKSTFFEA
jgi:hypothetical protein